MALIVTGLALVASGCSVLGGDDGEPVVVAAATPEPEYVPPGVEGDNPFFSLDAQLVDFVAAQPGAGQPGAGQSDASAAVADTTPATPDQLASAAEDTADDVTSGPAEGSDLSVRLVGVDVPSQKQVESGLYGGTVEETCDAERLIEFLIANPDKGRAWADVQGIAFAELPNYIRSLTPTVLEQDTVVLNHGYDEKGHAIPIVSTLAAGTAVLVDDDGVIRTRCYCGNPILPYEPTTYEPPRCLSYFAQVWTTPGDKRELIDGVPRRVHATKNVTNWNDIGWVEVTWGESTGWVRHDETEHRYCKPGVKVDCVDYAQVTYEPGSDVWVGEITTGWVTVVLPQIEGWALIEYGGGSAWIPADAMGGETCGHDSKCVTVEWVADRPAEDYITGETGTVLASFTGHTHYEADTNWQQAWLLDPAPPRQAWVYGPTVEMVPDSDCGREYRCAAFDVDATVYKDATGSATYGVVWFGEVEVVSGPTSGRYEVRWGDGTGWIDAVHLYGEDCKPVDRCVSITGSVYESLPPAGEVGAPGGKQIVTFTGKVLVDEDDGRFKETVLDDGRTVWIPSLGYTAHDVGDCGPCPPGYVPADWGLDCVPPPAPWCARTLVAVELLVAASDGVTTSVPAGTIVNYDGRSQVDGGANWIYGMWVPSPGDAPISGWVRATAGAHSYGDCDPDPGVDIDVVCQAELVDDPDGLKFVAIVSWTPADEVLDVTFDWASGAATVTGPSPAMDMRVQNPVTTSLDVLWTHPESGQTGTTGCQAPIECIDGEVPPGGEEDDVPPGLLEGLRDEPPEVLELETSSDEAGAAIAEDLGDRAEILEPTELDEDDDSEDRMDPRCVVNPECVLTIETTELGPLIEATLTYEPATTIVEADFDWPDPYGDNLNVVGQQPSSLKPLDDPVDEVLITWRAPGSAMDEGTVSCETVCTDLGPTTHCVTDAACTVITDGFDALATDAPPVAVTVHVDWIPEDLELDVTFTGLVDDPGTISGMSPVIVAGLAPAPVNITATLIGDSDTLTLNCRRDLCVGEVAYAFADGARMDDGGDTDMGRDLCECPNQGLDVDPDTGDCTPQCRSDQRLTNGQCGCPAGTVERNGSCQTPTTPPPTCTGNRVLNNAGQCVCPTGTEDVQGSCLAPCTGPLVRAANGSCVCPAGTEATNNGCQRVCPTNLIANSDGVCVCPSGRPETTNGCEPAPCPDPLVRSTSGSCVCPTGTVPTDNGCEQPTTCPDGFVATDSGRCVCPAGFEDDGFGRCVPACRSTEVRNDQGVCVPRCRADQVTNGQGQCVCPRGTIELDGGCRTPPPLNCPEFYSGPDANNQCTQIIGATRDFSCPQGGTLVPVDGAGSLCVLPDVVETVPGIYVPATPPTCPDGYLGPDANGGCVELNPPPTRGPLFMEATPGTPPTCNGQVFTSGTASDCVVTQTTPGSSYPAVLVETCPAGFEGPVDGDCVSRIDAT